MSITDLMQRAESKDLKAMFELAEAYYLGDKGVDPNDGKAFGLYKELETLTPDDGMVLYRLGKCYEFGVGVDKDVNLALDYYQKAADIGSGIACKVLGEFYKTGQYVKQDISMCMEYLNKGAGLKTPGSDEAAIMLGDMYHSGDGVEKNEAKACELYRMAADLGNSNAYYRLGMQTFNGWGVTADKPQGMEYWKKGADLNHWGCMYIVGVSYLEGNDLPKDIEKGLYWLERSASRGLADAQCYLGKVYLRGLHGAPKNVEKGVQLLKAAIESDQVEAMMIYGDYLYGKKTQDSLSEALKLYRLAAEQGEPAAFHRLGILTYNGTGVEPDKVKGIDYWKRGVELGHAGCMYIIGGTYLVGNDLPQDIQQGLDLIEKAAKQGLPEAHNYLGKVYLYGLYGVQKNEPKAFQHLRFAAESGQVEATKILHEQQNAKVSPSTPPQNKGTDSPEKEPSDDLGSPPVKPDPSHVNDYNKISGSKETGTKRKPLTYVLIGLVGLAAVVLLILVIGNKNRYQPNLPIEETAEVQETAPPDAQIEQEQTTAEEEHSSEDEPSSGTMLYQLPSYIGISHPWEFYGAETNFEYMSDGGPLSIETEVEGTVLRAEFGYKKYFVVESALYEDGVLSCTGIYHYEDGVIQSITYTYNEFGQEKTGSVDFRYSQDGDTYIIDIVPNIEEGYYYLPERFLEVPGIGGVPFGVSELRFEYQMNNDGTIRQLHVRNKEAMEYDTAGWTIQYHSNGVPSMIGYEYVHSSNDYQVYYDENGLPLYGTGPEIKRLSNLELNGQSFTESEFVRIIGYVDSTGERDFFQYEVYETNAQHSEMIRTKFNSNGELLEHDTTEWEYYSVDVLDSPFPFLYHLDLDG